MNKFGDFFNLDQVDSQHHQLTAKEMDVGPCNWDTAVDVTSGNSNLRWLRPHIPEKSPSSCCNAGHALLPLTPPRTMTLCSNNLMNGVTGGYMSWTLTLTRLGIEV